MASSLGHWLYQPPQVFSTVVVGDPSRALVETGLPHFSFGMSPLSFRDGKLHSPPPDGGLGRSPLL